MLSESGETAMEGPATSLKGIKVSIVSEDGMPKTDKRFDEVHLGKNGKGHPILEACGTEGESQLKKTLVSLDSLTAEQVKFISPDTSRAWPHSHTGSNQLKRKSSSRWTTKPEVVVNARPILQITLTGGKRILIEKQHGARDSTFMNAFDLSDAFSHAMHPVSQAAEDLLEFAASLKAAISTTSRNQQRLYAVLRMDTKPVEGFRKNRPRYITQYRPELLEIDLGLQLIVLHDTSDGKELIQCSVNNIKVCEIDWKKNSFHISVCKKCGTEWRRREAKCMPEPFSCSKIEMVLSNKEETKDLIAMLQRLLLDQGPYDLPPSADIFIAEPGHTCQKRLSLQSSKVSFHRRASDRETVEVKPGRTVSEKCSKCSHETWNNHDIMTQEGYANVRAAEQTVTDNHRLSPSCMPSSECTCSYSQHDIVPGSTHLYHPEQDGQPHSTTSDGGTVHDYLHLSHDLSSISQPETEKESKDGSLPPAYTEAMPSAEPEKSVSSPASGHLSMYMNPKLPRNSEGSGSAKHKPVISKVERPPPTESTNNPALFSPPQTQSRKQEVPPHQEGEVSPALYSFV